MPSIRIPIDRNSALSECHIELEVLQEFSVPSATVRDERVPLGVVRLNLSEFVEESDAITSRKRSASLGAMGSPPIPRVHGGDEVAEDGIVRRYLMQESKVNSTLQIGILMVQIDGERNYAAPPLKSAPVFGGIAGFMAGEQVEQDDTAGRKSKRKSPIIIIQTGSQTAEIPNIHKARDAAELQDLYRSALTAVWCAQPEEHPASAVVEDIFSGGNGWAISSARSRRAKSSGSAHYHDDGDESSGSISGDEGYGGTLRPSDFKRAQRRVARKLASERTLRAEGKKGGGDGGARSRSGSLASLAPTLGSSEREREAGLERARVREVSEAEARDDMVAWRLSGRV